MTSQQVCVSYESDVEKLTKAILNAVSPDEIRDGDDFNQVQLKLSKNLGGKRFLLVLDGVWNIKSYEQWSQLRAPLKSGERGSKVIVTTRDTNVASLMRADNYHHFLSPLSNDDCWLYRSTLIIRRNATRVQRCFMTCCQS